MNQSRAGENSGAHGFQGISQIVLALQRSKVQLSVLVRRAWQQTLDRYKTD